VVIADQGMGCGLLFRRLAALYVTVLVNGRLRECSEEARKGKYKKEERDAINGAGLAFLYMVSN